MSLRRGSGSGGGGYSNGTLRSNVSDASRASRSDKIRVKCHFKDTRQIMVPLEVTFKDFQVRIQKKFESARPLRLKYKDGDTMVTMTDQEDMEIAFDMAGAFSGGSVEVWCFD
ncbi:hypothetical protein BC830DRAFT_1175015 [Chytriomyces sp. MP71]|nr:hypothetical protein BC830DRAFT_1175015 [Chytriomyces sp. MP71]